MRVSASKKESVLERENEGDVLTFIGGRIGYVMCSHELLLT